ncbi:MAG: ribonuclease G [Bacteroidetes bacterium RBG_13_46_8]|nr:MAG: ribonuclease G [Bacteroidetes bacterium RBG_13_46_8]
MNKELIIDAASGDINIALLEDKKLVELTKEKSNLQFAVGDIYLGKVKKLMPGLNAAFVDVGFEKDAFLHYLDLGPQFRTLHKYFDFNYSRKGKVPSFQKFKRERDIDKDGKITEVVNHGQLVMVQIAKEPISTKGPRLTSEISIAGRNLVLIPFSDKVSVSQKISSEEERKRLRMLVGSIKPANYGVIVRTVAEGRKVKDLDLELKGLVRKWESAFDSCKGVKPPHLFISELNRTSTILRDVLSVSFNNIFVNNETILRELREYISTIAPEKEKIIKLYTGNVPIFEHFGIEKQVKSSFGKTVSFRNGAYLIIEHTEALHVVDVNSGNRSKNVSDQETNAFETNSAAAEEIARQLRLRDMGGIIVIDFIDMKSSDHKQQITERMRKVMDNDRAKHSILPLSKFGLMQITRQRVRPEMNINTTEKCPTCLGTGEISPSILFVDKIENHIADILQKRKHKTLTLKVHSYVAAYILKGLFSIRYRWRFKYHCRIHVLAISSYDFLEYHIYDKQGEEISS